MSIKFGWLLISLIEFLTKKSLALKLFIQKPVCNVVHSRKVFWKSKTSFKSNFELKQL